jgi:hypothetical protein
MLESLSRDKRSSLLGPYVSYNENEGCKYIPIFINRSKGELGKLMEGYQIQMLQNLLSVIYKFEW